jgi:DNA-binding protein H-NS
VVNSHFTYSGLADLPLSRSGVHSASCQQGKNGEAFMAKKAKRRGRPPGSKNEPKVGNGKSAGNMEVGQLRSYIDGLQAMLAKKIARQRAVFEAKLSELSGYGSPTTARTGRPPATPTVRKRAKAKPKYQSKKNRKLKWSGRGMTPIWMRDEMKGTKLKKESFLIQ